MKMRRLRNRLAERERAGVGDAVWAFKRARQRSDLAAMAAGSITQDELAWFSRGKTRGLGIIGAPYQRRWRLNWSTRRQRIISS